MSPIRKRLSQYAMFSGRTKGSSETPMTHLGSKGFAGVGLGVTQVPLSSRGFTVQG